MIFVTVGSDIPFDRLIRTVDQWARKRGRTDVFAQIGRGGWEPEYISSAPLLEPAEFKERLLASNVVVGHAGMGTILTALQQSKPVLVMPRRGKLGETRNDHQMATARHLSKLGKINVALDEEELSLALDSLESLGSGETISPYAEIALTNALRGFIHRENVM